MAEMFSPYCSINVDIVKIVRLTLFEKTLSTTNKVISMSSIYFFRLRILFSKYFASRFESVSSFGMH